ncbi:MAG: hypothetical protein ACD_5C00268G0004 [uncultured bacterium]|nr:MAG: hypothetical protein ACD_5C00268G0004 [uncultured bacterium]
MSNKLIILSTISFLLVSFLFLSWSEEKQADINSKNVWMIYFTNPRDTSLDFKIENHSDISGFEYKLLEDKNILKQESISVSKGETVNVPASFQGKGKVTIQVETKDRKKEIYKTF